jgi:hypothetical protein
MVAPRILNSTKIDFLFSQSRRLLLTNQLTEGDFHRSFGQRIKQWLCRHTPLLDPKISLVQHDSDLDRNEVVQVKGVGWQFLGRWRDHEGMVARLNDTAILTTVTNCFEFVQEVTVYPALLQALYHPELELYTRQFVTRTEKGVRCDDSGWKAVIARYDTVCGGQLAALYGKSLVALNTLLRFYQEVCAAHLRCLSTVANPSHSLPFRLPEARLASEFGLRFATAQPT